MITAKLIVDISKVELVVRDDFGQTIFVHRSNEQEIRPEDLFNIIVKIKEKDIECEVLTHVN